MMKEERIFQLIPSKSVCHAYELLLKDKLVSFPLTQDAKDKVDAIVSSINSFYFGKEIYNTPEEKLVAYLYFLIKDHPFTDGNKRTACLVFEIGCDINGVAPNYTEFKLDTVAVFIEKIQEQDHHRVIKMLVEILF